MLAELEQARVAWTRVSRDLTDRRKHGKRTCSKCKKLKGPDGFYNHKRDTRAQCKACMNEQKRAWRARLKAEDPERYQEHLRREWAQRQRGRAA